MTIARASAARHAGEQPAAPAEPQELTCGEGLEAFEGEQQWQCFEPPQRPQSQRKEERPHGTDSE